LELVPLKSSFRPGEAIRIEIRPAAEGSARVFHLDRLTAEVVVQPDQRLLELEPLPIGGYGVDLEHADGIARTAFDILPDPLARPRYGFVSGYERGRQTAPVLDNVRRLHLNAIQFYDWMYRHAQLLPPGDDYDDPLGRRLSLATVKTLAAGLAGAGSLPLAYAAVYAVGREEWPEWRAAGLNHADGRPWTLGEDFLWIVNPSDRRWLAHFEHQLAAAAGACGFAGFHLDQYGNPKRAVQGDGTTVDLARAFTELIETVRGALPQARLIFNNVNNYPTWATASAPQDAIYIEVWPPHTRLDHLARLVREARAHAPPKPVILAAYLSVFDSDAEQGAMNAARLTMATIFSHGASHLLAGEEAGLLTDPYYVRHHDAGAATQAMLRHWYDFAVRYGDLLYDNRAVDVTTALAAGVNEDVIVEDETAVAVDAEPGTIWLRIVETGAGLVLHLIDLSRETDIDWDRSKRGGGARTQTRVSLRRSRNRAPVVNVASPEVLPALVPASHTSRNDYEVYELPAWQSWAVVLVQD
jgi:dextranase